MLLFWVAIQCRPELLKMQTVCSPDGYVLMSVHDITTWKKNIVTITAVRNSDLANWVAGRSFRPGKKKSKSKAVPLHAMEALGGRGCISSYSFTTSALDGGEWSASRPGRALPPGKGPPVPIVQEAGWAPEPVWTQRLEEKSLVPAGDRTPIARSSSP
jgi:hypothetical protein